MRHLKGLRTITNLHCNNHCKFCYQKDKSAKILDLNEFLAQVKPYNYKHFEYCTIMGGESTLLSNLPEYIKIGSLYAKETRLTTNGVLLTPKLFNHYLNAGLNGINISIATIKKYDTVHGIHPNFDIDKLLDMIDYMHGHSFNPANNFSVRVNIPLCKENCEGKNPEILFLLDYFTRMNINVTMCEDIKGSYSFYNEFDKILCDVKEVTDYGLILLDYNGHQIGYYTHRNNNYNETDLVVSPLGTWINWDGYCKAVGMNT